MQTRTDSSNAVFRFLLTPIIRWWSDLLSHPWHMVSSYCLHVLRPVHFFHFPFFIFYLLQPAHTAHQLIVLAAGESRHAITHTMDDSPLRGLISLHTLEIFQQLAPHDSPKLLHECIHRDLRTMCAFAYAREALTSYFQFRDQSTLLLYRLIIVPSHHTIQCEWYWRI